MSDDGEFDVLMRSIQRLQLEFERAVAERAAGETLIASAEYELASVKEALAGARLEPESTPSPAEPMPLRLVA